MLNGITYTEAKIQSIALHLIRLLSRQINYFSETSLDGYFKLTSDIYFFLNQCHSKFEKPGGQTIGLNIGFFLYDFNNFNKNWGRMSGLLYFMAKLYK